MKRLVFFVCGLLIGCASGDKSALYGGDVSLIVSEIGGAPVVIAFARFFEVMYPELDVGRFRIAKNHSLAVGSEARKRSTKIGIQHGLEELSPRVPHVDPGSGRDQPCSVR